MSRLRDVIRKWEEDPPYEGIRIAGESDIEKLKESAIEQIEFILEAMEGNEILIFKYDDEERVAVPFVVGVSSEGNPLMRGYQLDGISRSGKGAGWRVFQIQKMAIVDWYFEYFDFVGVGFDRKYPWIYKVINMI